MTIALTCKSESELILTYQRRTLAYEPVGLLQLQLTVGKFPSGSWSAVSSDPLAFGGTMVGYNELRQAAESSPIRISEIYPKGGALLGGHAVERRICASSWRIAKILQ